MNNDNKGSKLIFDSLSGIIQNSWSKLEACLDDRKYFTVNQLTADDMKAEMWEVSGKYSWEDILSKFNQQYDSGDFDEHISSSSSSQLVLRILFSEIYDEETETILDGTVTNVFFCNDDTSKNDTFQTMETRILNELSKPELREKWKVVRLIHPYVNDIEARILVDGDGLSHMACIVFTDVDLHSAVSERVFS